MPLLSEEPESYREAEAKSLVRTSGVTDPWFVGRYGMNLYRGCAHGCAYCDGRAERYYVEGDFARDILVKSNAVALFENELSRFREPGFVFLGGGVSDSYQPAEAKYGLARGILELCLAHSLPVCVLTKSARVERDLDLLTSINTASRAVLAFSIATTDDELRQAFEPRASPLAERWRLLREAKQRGLGTAVMAMPLLPGLSDQPQQLDALVGKAAEVGVDYVCTGGMTLRPGVQQDTYLKRLRETRPDLLPGYARLYQAARPSGAPDPRYSKRLEERVRAALLRHQMPGRMPHRLFSGVLPTYAEVALLLEHRGFARGEPGWGHGPLGRAGAAIQTWARTKLARRRGASLWRHVEDEFAELMQSRALECLVRSGPFVMEQAQACYAEVLHLRQGAP